MAEINKLPDSNHEPEKKATDDKKKKKKLGFFARVARWFRELRSELKKVTWPTPSQIVNNTIVAVVVMVISAVCIWGFDYIAGLAVRTLISLVG